MVEDNFYGEAIEKLLSAEQLTLNQINVYRAAQSELYGYDPVQYCNARIKSPASVREKLRRKGLPETANAAFIEITDIVGIRIVCRFMDDVYAIAEYLEGLAIFKVKRIRDYISCPKPNGYRSYHLVVQIANDRQECVFAEIQIRTMAIDCWASLEHQMKYKHQIKHQKLIVSELKRCADEIASTDISMQTIRELIHSGE